MDELLHVSMIAGPDVSSQKLLAEAKACETSYSALSLKFAESRAAALEILEAPCHILVISGHGYAGDEWTLSGIRHPLLRESDLPAQFNASFVIADTCHMNRDRWLARTAANVSLAGWSDADQPELVDADQAAWIIAMLTAAAAGFDAGPEYPAYYDWAPEGLRATWDQVLSPRRSFNGPARYWTFPVA